MQIKVSELSGIALDWAVAKVEGKDIIQILRDNGNTALTIECYDGFNGFFDYSPSTDWSQGGPIIERDAIWLGYLDGIPAAHKHIDVKYLNTGPTPLIAAMRCYVASELGGVVDVPDELMED